MVATASLSEALAALRVLSDEAVRPMRQSLDAFEPAVRALLTEAMGASAPVFTRLSASIARALAGRDLRDVVVE